MLQRKLFPVLYWLVVLGLFVALGHTLRLLRPAGTSEVERTVLAFFVRLQGPFLDEAVPVASVLGIFAGYVPLTGIAVAAIAQKSIREAVFVGLATFGAGLYYLPLNRFFFTRARPSWFADVSAYEGHAFPSGHALISVALAASVWLATRRLAPRWSWPMALLGLGFVALNAFNRLYLQVHHPSDILGGWLVASAWVWGLDAWVRRRGETERT